MTSAICPIGVGERISRRHILVILLHPFISWDKPGGNSRVRHDAFPDISITCERQPDVFCAVHVVDENYCPRFIRILNSDGIELVGGEMIALISFRVLLGLPASADEAAKLANHVVVVGFQVLCR